MPRFVVLEHRRSADEVHWDFLLEHGPALATWALALPPTVETLIDARQLPDHRLAYLDQEGPISGDRGTIRRIDRGTYQAIRWSASGVLVDLDGDNLRGLVELRQNQAEGPALGTDQGWTFRLLAGKTS